MIKQKKMVSRKWFIILLCVCMAFVIGFTAIFIYCGYANKILAKLGLKSKKASINYSAAAWNKCLHDLEIDCDIAFLGDSITSGGDFSSYFPDVTICNLGIPGDSLLMMNERVYMLKTVKPEKIFILGGINGITNYNTDMTYNEYNQLLDNVCKNCSNSEVYIIGILPISREQETKLLCSNNTIISFNKRLSELAEEKGATYIDLSSSLLFDGAMNPAYTSDGVHLNKTAYDVWAKTISEYIY